MHLEDDANDVRSFGDQVDEATDSDEGAFLTTPTAPIACSTSPSRMLCDDGVTKNGSELRIHLSSLNMLHSNDIIECIISGQLIDECLQPLCSFATPS